MIRTLLSAAGILFLTSAYAYAAEEEKKPPEGCQFVTLTRDGIDPSKPDIHMTFRGYGADVAAIQFCNPKGTTDVIGVTVSTVDGARVSVRTKNGAGVVGLPKIYAAGSIEQRVCGIKEGKIVSAIYAIRWDGGLPAELKPVDETDKIGDAGGVAACESTMPPQMKAQLKG